MFLIWSLRSLLTLSFFYCLILRGLSNSLFATLFPKGFSILLLFSILLPRNFLTLSSLLILTSDGLFFWWWFFLISSFKGLWFLISGFYFPLFLPRVGLTRLSSLFFSFWVDLTRLSFSFQRISHILLFNYFFGFST